MPEYVTGQMPVVGPSVLDQGHESFVAPQTHVLRELQRQIIRLRQERGRLLCRKSPVVALKAAALAGGGTLAAGAVVGWLVLHGVPTVVVSMDQRVVLALAGAVFALTVPTAVAGYVSARWRHARSIPTRGRIGARGVGLVLAFVAFGGVVAALEPWVFPSANVLVVSPIVLGQYLAQGEVVGGLVVDIDNEPVAYLKTNLGGWVSAAISTSSVAAVEKATLTGLPYTPGEIAGVVGGGQPAALRSDTDRLWLVVGAMGLWAVAVGVIQRYRWRSAPWPAPVASDTLRTMVGFYSRRR